MNHERPASTKITFTNIHSLAWSLLPWVWKKGKVKFYSPAALASIMFGARACFLVDNIWQ